MKLITLIRLLFVQCERWDAELLQLDVHNASSTDVASLNLSPSRVLNQFTDPPFHTEKINFLLKINKIQSLLDSLSRLHNAVGGRGLSVCQSQLCRYNAATGFWWSVGGIGGTACAGVKKGTYP